MASLAKHRYGTGARSNQDRDAIRQDANFRNRWRRTEAWGADLGDNPKKILELVPDFDAAINYTADQLLLQAERILCEDDRGIGEYPAILRKSHIENRKRREIYVNSGTPDPSVVQGIYNRTHPQGRKYKSPEERKANGDSFYA